MISAKKLSSAQLLLRTNNFSGNLIRVLLHKSVTYFARTFSHLVHFFLSGDGL